MRFDLKKTTIILFSTLSVVIIFIIVVFLHLVAQQENDGKVINIAGRQRMLSQKISKLSLQIVYDSLPSEAPEYTDLENSLALFKKSHKELEVINYSDSLSTMFKELQDSYLQITQNSTFILAQSGDKKHGLDKLLLAEKAFLPKMNKIVFQYDNENKKKVDNLRFIILVNISIMGVIILLELIFMVLPALRQNLRYTTLLKEKAQKIQQKNDEILASEEELRQNNEELLTLAENNELQKKRLLEDAKKLRLQAALAQILKKSTSVKLEINDFLQAALTILLELPWLNIVSKGSIFLTTENGNLEMIAQKDLGILTKMCAVIKPGQCLCGKALAQKKTLFSNCVNNHEHDIQPEGMKEHGHYNIPIMIKDEVLGVLNLYVPHKHIQTDDEQYFLETIANTLASVIYRTKLQHEILKTTEELQKYYTVIEQSPATIVFTDKKGVIQYANPEFERLTGYTISEVIGKRSNLLKSGQTPAKTFHDLWSTITRGENWAGEFINKKKDGSHFVEHAVISPIKNSKGKITSYVAIKEDVTELYEAQKALKKLNISLKQSVEITVKQKEIIERSHKNITSSINYAKTIQQALLPTKTIENNLDKEYFILYKPKEIVSGDFYYFHKNKNKLLFAAADCTGHGVPGAFMTLLSITFLNGIIKKRKDCIPSEILEELRTQIIGLFSENKTENKNGLDIALCAVDTQTNILQFSGAYNPLWIIRDGKLLEYKATKSPIGNHPRFLNFENTNIQLQHNDLIYIFSDGYYDQFGGLHNRKFTKKLFRKLLLEVKDMPLDEQKEILEHIFIKWKGEIDQVDDILVMALKWTIESDKNHQAK